MKNQDPIIFNWSSGKDSALSLYKLKQSGVNVDVLVTTLSQSYDRVVMHGTRKELLIAQAESMKIPIRTIYLPENPSMEEYESVILNEFTKLRSLGYSNMAFGDIFLEDLKQYREKLFENCGYKLHFPIWERDTTELIYEFIELGFKAVIVSASSKYFSEDILGKDLDEGFINHLPQGVDPCGENGEFHTFCYDGPIFSNPIEFSIGKKVYKEYPSPGNNIDPVGFWFCDLLPAKTG